MISEKFMEWLDEHIDEIMIEYDLVSADEVDVDWVLDNLDDSELRILSEHFRGL